MFADLEVQNMHFDLLNRGIALPSCVIAGGQTRVGARSSSAISMPQESRKLEDSDLASASKGILTSQTYRYELERVVPVCPTISACGNAA